MEKDNLLQNIDKLHTTTLGEQRIKRNLKLDTDDVVVFCKNEIIRSSVTRKGKNYYADIGNAVITVNAYNMGIITAHLK